MAEQKVNTTGGTMIASAEAPTSGATMIAGTSPTNKKVPPPVKPAARTMVAGTPGAPPAPPPAPAPDAAKRDDFASGGTMMASGGTMMAGGDAVPAAVAVAEVQPPSGDLTGQTLLGRYEILKKLGEGGMGTVYLGEHTTIKKKLAIKVLSQEFAHKKDLKDRFLQEARAASMIDQENVVEINDFGDTPDGSSFFVMEFLAGEDLSDTLKKNGKLPWARVKPIMLQICRALAAAHDAGIIHRDMKPENCYRITRGKNEDFIKVLDFGIAKVTTEEEGGKEGKGLTKTGMIFGTPEYMSPEQAQGARPDHRVDIYAIGVIMYELLTGKVPFHADTFMGILTKHMFEVPQAPSAMAPDADIPPEVEAIILKAMQKDRDLRFQSMGEMADAIEKVGSGAAAVVVINENIARPTQGEMVFTGGRPTPVPGTVPPVAVAYEEPQRSNKGLMFGLVGGLVLAAAGVGAFFAFNSDKGEGKKDEPAVAAKEADPPKTDPATVAGTPETKVEPTPEPEKVKQLAADIAKVTYTITTKDPGGNPVVAKIFDPRDNAIYGMTNGEKGVEVEKMDTEMALILRADGFEDLEVKIVPNRDKTFEYTLNPVKKKVTTTKKDPKTDTKTDPKTDTKTDPKTDTKTDPKKDDPPPRRVTSDLKDPFNRGK